MKPHVSGRVAIMEGPKFNLSLVMAAHYLVLDKILEGAGRIQMAAEISKGNRFEWPAPGKKVAKQIWESLKNLHDVDARPLMLIGNDIVVQVRLLGNTWVIQDANTGELKLHDGKPLASLNPTPNLTVLGPWDESKKKYRLMTEAQVDRIGALIDKGPLARLKLDFQRLTEANHQSLRSGYTDYARISFPYGSYGLQRDIITVRCVSSDGKEPDPTSHVEN